MKAFRVSIQRKHQLAFLEEKLREFNNNDLKKYLLEVLQSNILQNKRKRRNEKVSGAFWYYNSLKKHLQAWKYGKDFSKYLKIMKVKALYFSA